MLFGNTLAPGEPDDGGGDHVGACDGDAQRQRDGERQHEDEKRGSKEEPQGDAKEAEAFGGSGHGGEQGAWSRGAWSQMRNEE